ncbi:MAG: aminoacyl-tRNA hydrolase [Bacillota bacterium]|nr:aminoacyl-tRNA hydrolase [Bacillota bacterium]
MRLVVGLGNPGRRYENTRHNAGFLVLDRLAERLHASEWRRLDRALVAEGAVDGEKVVLVKPQTYMNLSGLAVRALLDWFKLTPEALLVIYDDMDLPVGRLRLRLEGSSAGHKGMESVLAQVGTEKVARLRVGIGRPAPPMAARDYVLSPFSPEEARSAAQALERAAEAVLCWLRQGAERAMNIYNSDQNLP